MRLLSVTITLFSCLMLCWLSTYAAENVVPSAEAELFIFKVSLKDSADPNHIMSQEVEVKTHDRFHVVTTIGGAQWVVQGTTGDLIDKRLAINFTSEFSRELHINGYAIPDRNKCGASPFDLEIDGPEQRIGSTSSHIRTRIKGKDVKGKYKYAETTRTLTVSASLRKSSKASH